ncbi:MAG: FlgD immunoglobulin-like domain containing protein [Candidatus Eisenbacteria bacterium]
MRTILTMAVATTMLTFAGSAGALDWSPEEIVGGDDGYNDSGACVGVTPDGRVWVVWKGRDPVQEDTEIYFSVLEGLRWKDRERLHPDNSREELIPQMSVGSDGVPWVTWSQNTPGGYALTVSHLDGDAWSSPEVIRPDGDRYDYRAVLAVNSDDVWVATDAYVDSFPDRVILTYHWDGSTWSEPWTLHLEGVNHQPSLAVSPAGTPWVVWMAGEPGCHYSVVRSTFHEGAWAPPDTVNSDEGNCYRGIIGFGADGTPVVVWEGNGHLGMGPDIEYSYWDGSAWTEAALVHELGDVYDGNTSVACDFRADGDLWLAWTALDFTDIFSQAVVVSRWTGAGWSAEELVSDSDLRQFDTWPDVALAPDGDVWVAWQQYAETPPYDEDIVASHGSVQTPVDFCCLQAASVAGGVQLHWSVSGQAADGPFHVWRVADAEGLDYPGIPPDEASHLAIEMMPGGPATWVDESAAPGVAYAYWLEWERPGGSSFVGPAHAVGPSTAQVPLRLLFTYPNPSRTGCCVAYEVGETGSVSLEIYDVSGRLVRRVTAGTKAAGRYEDPGQLLCWDGTDRLGFPAASGVYYGRLTHQGRPTDGRISVTVVR